MANKKVEYTEVYQKDLFDNAIKGAENLLSTLNSLEDKFKDIIKTTASIANNQVFEDIDSLRKREKAINDNVKAQEGLDKVEKERLKLEAKLKEALDKRSVANEKLKKQIAEQIKQNKLNAGAINKQLTEEEKLRRKLISAQSEEAKTRAKLRLQIQEANRVAKENAKIEGVLGPYAKKSATLDKLRKRYKDLAAEQKETTQEAKDLLKEIQKLDKELKDLDDTVGQNQRSVGSYKRAVGSLNSSLKLLSKAAVIGVLTQLVSSFSQSESGANLLSKAIAEATVRFSIFANGVAQGFKAIDKEASVFKQIQQFFTGTSDALDDYEERVKKALDAQKQVFDNQIEGQRTIAELTKELGETEKAQARYTVSATDATLSLKEQSKANTLLRAETLKVLKLQIEIAKENEKIAEQKRKASLEARGDGKADAAVELELAEATRERQQAEAERIDFLQASAANARLKASDIAEIELDVLLDAGDRLKTIRETFAKDETQSFVERAESLQQAELDIEKSFREQVSVIETLIGESLNIDDLIAETDTVKLKKLVSDIEASENIQKRIIEVINEKRIADQDLADANTDLTRTEEESLRVAKETSLITQAIIDLQEEKVELDKLLIRLEKDKTEAQIEGLEERLKAVDKGSQEALQIEAEIARLKFKILVDSINQEKALKDKEDEEDEKRNNDKIRAEKEAQEAILAIARSLAQKRADIQQRAIDRELSAVQARQEQLREVSQRGQADAEQALAREERREAELLRKKEQQVRRQARLELALSAIETYSSKVENNSPNPLTSTITDIGVLQAFISSLPAFFTGAENISDSLGAPQIAGRDGYIVRVDGSERVMTGEQNKLVGGMSNADLAMLAYNHRTGKDVNTVVNAGIDKDDMQEVMNKSMQNIPVYAGLRYDHLNRALIEEWKAKGKIERKHRKTGSIW